MPDFNRLWLRSHDIDTAVALIKPGPIVGEAELVPCVRSSEGSEI